ncbi:hydrogenase maturation nickel metallochaperone HypA/HybF [Streptomyces niveus]
MGVASLTLLPSRIWLSVLSTRVSSGRPYAFRPAKLSQLGDLRKAGRSMHELSITQSIVDAVCERAAGRPVHTVSVRVGMLTAVVPDSMRFCFDLTTAGTVAEGAALEIEQPPGTARCRACSADFTLTDLVLLCPCGSADVEITSGRELQIISMRVG